MPVNYEIYQRQPGQHRAGHFALRINGVEAEYTCNPAQFAPKALREALETGAAPGPDATAAADEICERYARKSIQRVIDRLRHGSLVPGGFPITPAGGLDTSAKRTERVSEAEAVAAFLSRGNLSKDVEGAYNEDGKPVRMPLTAEERAARIEARDEQTDHQAEWQERRKALIAARKADLEQAQAQLAAAPRERKPKVQRTIDFLTQEIEALQVGVLCASHGFQYAYGQYLTKQVDLVNDDIRIVPCMTNTTVDTERDAKDQVSDFTTLDEFDGSGYSSGGLALDSQAVNIDDANDRAEFDAADEAATLGAGTRSIQGILLIAYITSLNASLPLHWIEFASNKTPDGSVFTFVFNAEGILQAADG